MVAPRYYLDYNATAPLRREVRERLEVLLSAGVANPSGIHAESRRARAIVDSARDAMASMLGGRASEIIFTSGGTEANNLALFGLSRAARASGRGAHLVVSAVEHHAILHAARQLERDGFSVTIVPVDALGRVEPAVLAGVLREDTVLAAVMSANNETGVRQPIQELAQICRERGVLFHTDAVQSFGKEPVRVEEWHVDSLAIASHKIGGVPGAGALWVRAGLPVEPQLFGGSQEHLRRAGTENVLAIAGMAVAASAALAEMHAEKRRQREWIEALWGQLHRQIPGLHRNGQAQEGLPNTLNLSVEAVSGEELLIACDMAGLAVSSGSACMVGSAQPSHVLLAMGVSEVLARSAVRFSIGPGISLDAVDAVAARFLGCVQRLRQEEGHPPEGLSSTETERHPRKGT